MANRADLTAWVLEALRDLGGSGRPADVCRAIWNRHEHELRASGDFFFTWQYDVRWAAKGLRDQGHLKPAGVSRKGHWELR